MARAVADDQRISAFAGIAGVYPDAVAFAASSPHDDRTAIDRGLAAEEHWRETGEAETIPAVAPDGGDVDAMGDPIVDDDFANVTDRFLVNQIVRGVVAAIPRGLVIHQHLNLALACRIRHGVGVIGADRQWLFHHDGYTVPGADFHHLQVVEGIGVG